jgi:uncharacterized membrane protein
MAAFLAYLLGPLGSLYVLIFRRNDHFAVYHAVQSLGLCLVAIGLFAGWLVIGWLIMWIPLGGVLSFGLFGLVIAGWLFAFVVWIIGMVRALKGEVAALPMVGRWAEGLPVERLFPHRPIAVEPELPKVS